VDFSALETHLSFGRSEQRVVPAHADVGAGKELGPALSDDYRAGFRRLASVELYASVLRIAVSAVPR